MSITEIAIKRPILFIVLFLIITGFGIMSYKNLKYELLPDLVTPFVTVITEYPGASPKEVEDAITKKVEESVAGVSKIKRVSSQSSEDLSVVTIEFTPDVDVNQAAQETQRAVSKVIPEFPANVKLPSIEKYNVNDLPVLRIGVTSNLTETELFKLVKDDIKIRLNQVKNIGQTKIIGGASREVNVAVIPEKLAYYQISIAEITEAIRKYNSNVPLGNVKDNDLDIGLRLNLKADNIEGLSNIPIRSNSNTGTIYLKDLAQIHDQAKEPSVFARVNRKNSIGLFITKQTGSNAVELSEGVRNALTELEKTHANKDLKFIITQDSSEFTVQAANAVYKDFFIALFLVAIVMLVFLHSLRNAFIVMLAIPTSLMTSFIIMYFMGYTLNLMTLLAMSLVIGILVDDSIVVLENIYRHLEMGKDKVKASLDGRNEIGFAALSITLVDVVVFLPLFFIPGLVGSLVKQFSLVIVVSTLTSLLVSFTLTPMIASRFAKLETPNPNTFFGRISHFLEHLIKRLTDWYVVKLMWCLKHKAITISVTIGILFGSFGLISGGFVGSEFAPSTDKGELSLLINLQPGTKLSDTHEAVKEIEEKIKNLPEIERVFSTVGYQSSSNGEAFSPNAAAINVSLVPASKRTKSLKEIGRQIRNTAMTVPNIKARVSPVGLLGADDSPIILVLKSENRDSLVAAANKLLDYVRTIEGTFNSRLSTELGKAEFELVIDKEKAALLGVNVENIGFVLRNAINGFEDLKLKTPTGEVNMKIQFKAENRDATDKIPYYAVQNEAGQLVYLNQFTSTRLISSASTLERRNKQSSISVISQVSGKSVGDVGEEIRSHIAKASIPNNVILSYEGDLELQDDSFGKLGLALLTSFLLIYLIMVSLYNNWSYPFVVLFSIPVALIGALLALALTAKSLNVFSIFGLIMMMGLVAKNAILLVDRTNEARAEGMNLIDAILNAGQTRMRPILMTTLAMVIGMMPIAFAKGAGAELNSGMAWVLIGGLSSSMFLTLVFVPVIYYLVATALKKFENSNDENKKENEPERSNIQKVIGILIIGLFSFSYTQAQTNQLSLEQALHLGFTNNVNIQTAQIEQLKSKFLKQESASYLYPNITGGLGYNRNIKPPVFFFPSFDADPNTGALIINDKKLVPVNAASDNVYDLRTTFTMPIYNQNIIKGLQIAKLNEKLQNENFRLTKVQIGDEIQIAYFNTLLAEEQKKVAEKSIASAERNLLFIKSQFEQGLVKASDTLTVYINVESMKAGLLRTKNAIKQSENLLKYLIGLPIETSIQLTDSLSFKEMMKEGKNIDFMLRPEFRINMLNADIAKKQISMERSRYLPDLQFISQYQILTQANDFQFRDYKYPQAFFVGIQLNVPIFDGFRTNSKVQFAKAQLRQTEIQQTDMKNKINLEVQNAIDNLNEAKANYELQSNLIKSTQQNLDLVTDRWRQGLLRFIEVSEAELELIKAQITQTGALHQYKLAQIAYQRALGKNSNN
jgi:hydrophobe/amphiphile efflux-1 (HAE1) family protein